MTDPHDPIEFKINNPLSRIRHRKPATRGRMCSQNLLIFNGKDLYTFVTVDMYETVVSIFIFRLTVASIFVRRVTRIEKPIQLDSQGSYITRVYSQWSKLNDRMKSLLVNFRLFRMLKILFSKIFIAPKDSP